MSNETADIEILPRWARRIFHAVIAVSVFSMMALIFCDVFLRYLFNSPLVGAFEIIQFLLAIVIFSSLPLVIAGNGHVTVGLFEGYFRGMARTIQLLFVSALSVFTLGLVSWLMIKQGNLATRLQKVTGYLELPVAWLIYVIAGLAAASLIVHVLVTIKTFQRAKGTK